MNDFSLFLGKFVTNITRGNPIASIAPSSRWLSRTTLRNIDWDRVGVLVELGAGTGPITRAIAEKARPDCQVIVIERDADFARLLRERFGSHPNFEVVEGDARDLCRILADRGIKQVDHVISGLPVPSFPEELQRQLLPGMSGRSSDRKGPSTRSPNLPGSIGGSIVNSSNTLTSCSSPATCLRPGRISVGAQDPLVIGHG